MTMSACAAIQRSACARRPRLAAPSACGSSHHFAPAPVVLQFTGIAPSLSARSFSIRPSGGRCESLRARASTDAQLPSGAAGVLPPELPCLPFPAAESFVPGAVKSLHLYEARYLALLEEAMANEGSVFAHIVIEQLGEGQSLGMEGQEVGASFVATAGCLVEIEDIRTLAVGALVKIRGIGRVKLESLTSLQPYLRGRVSLMADEVPEDPARVLEAAKQLREVVEGGLALSRKLNPDGFAKKIGLESALEWVDKSTDELEAAERMSFAALQALPGSTTGDLANLLQKRVKGMETTSTLERLESALEYGLEIRGMLSAKWSLSKLTFGEGEVGEGEGGEGER